MLTTDYPHLHWRSHRGMLELDEFLLPFIEARYSTLSAQERETYARLLEEQDPVLFAWVLGGEPIEDKAYAQLLARIHQYHRSGI